MRQLDIFEFLEMLDAASKQSTEIDLDEANQSFEDAAQQDRCEASTDTIASKYLSEALYAATDPTDIGYLINTAYKHSIPLYIPSKDTK